MAAGLAEHFLHELGSAVGDLGLVGEGGRAVHEHAELHDSLDPVERAKRGLDLGEQANATAARGGVAGIEVHVLAKPPFDQAAVLGEADLAGNVQHPALLDGRDIGCHRRGGYWKSDAEFGKALVDAHADASSTRAGPNQPSRWTWKPAKLW